MFGCLAAAFLFGLFDIMGRSYIIRPSELFRCVTRSTCGQCPSARVRCAAKLMHGKTDAHISVSASKQGRGKYFGFTQGSSFTRKLRCIFTLPG